MIDPILKEFVDAEIIEDEDYPLNRIFHVGRAHAVTRRKTREAAISHKEAQEMVSRPYADILSDMEVNLDNPDDILSLIQKKLELFSKIKVRFTLADLLKIAPDIYSSLSKVVWNTEESMEQVLAVQSKLFMGDCNCAYAYVTVNKKRIIAILDTSAPENIVSSKLMCSMNLALDIDYNQSFGTAGPNTTKAIGAYSALSMRIGKFVVQKPTIVLPNKSYDMLIGASFFKE